MRAHTCVFADHEGPCPPVDSLAAIAAIAAVLEHLGEDASRDGLRDTPARVLKSLIEMTAGYKENPKEILSRTFELTDRHDEMIILRDIRFVSLCEHHLLPFVGVAHIGYLPGDIVGISKLARLVECFARRLQIQERMTRQIANAISIYLHAQGVGVVVDAQHSCMSVRGVRQTETRMVTSAMMGRFRDTPAARAEFLTLVRP